MPHQLISTSTGRLNESNFNPQRLILARMRRGLGQAELADKIDVDRRTIVAYENEEHAPSLGAIHRLSEVLDFPIPFFLGPTLEIPTPGAVSFRAQSKMSAKHRDMALAQGALALHLEKWIADRFHLPAAELPDFSQEPHPESAAHALRYAWGWGEQPIPNMIHLLESRGVRVFSLAVDSQSVDAFSLWHDQTPLIFLNTLKSSERSRFDAAHELGHLVLHRHVIEDRKRAEGEANRFASAFLMPASSIYAHAPVPPSLENILSAKQYWNVSAAALVQRMHDLQLISDWTHRSLFIEITERGYRQNEPNSLPRESSQILNKVLLALRNARINRDQLALELSISRAELEQIMFGLVLNSLKGGISTAP